MDTNGECFPVVGQTARYGAGGGGRGAARGRWKVGVRLFTYLKVTMDLFYCLTNFFEV